MSIRRDPVYLSYDVWRALRLLAKSKSEPAENRILTVDQLADQMLSEIIVEKYPQIIEHQKQIDKLEKELLK